MSAYSSLTNHHQVRAVLGILNADELPDTHIVNSNVEIELELDILDWFSGSVPKVVADGSAAGATTVQKQQYFALASYAKYFCSVSLANTFQILIEKSISDGQNELVRNELDLPQFLESLRNRRDAYKTKFLQLAGQTTQTQAALMGRAVPAYDPVTNTTS